MSDIPPGPDDVVTVKVGGDNDGAVTIDYGAGKDTHPDGSGEKPTAERARIAVQLAEQLAAAVEP